MQHRRKPASAAAPPAAKQPPARRPTARLSLAGLVVSVFLVATFLYNEDVVKAASRSSSVPATRAAVEVGVSGRARSPDLRVLQEAAHQDGEADALQKQQQEQEQEQEDRDRKEADQKPPPLTTLPVDNTKRQDEEQQTQKQPPPQAVADGCDLYRGRWTFDAAGEQAPLYRESECEFLTEQVTCMRNGRRDDSYQKWRWQPDGCDLPRYRTDRLAASPFPLVFVLEIGDEFVLRGNHVFSLVFSSFHRPNCMFLIRLLACLVSKLRIHGRGRAPKRTPTPVRFSFGFSGGVPSRPVPIPLPF
jgi:hypothetical protein